jgi:hypothetical protein
MERDPLIRPPSEDAMKKTLLSILAVLVIVAGLALTGCGGGGSSSGGGPPASPSGTIEGNAK